MTPIYQKHQILVSLETMSPSQMEKVHNYIKTLQLFNQPDVQENKVKVEAMRQIRQALVEHRL